MNLENPYAAPQADLAPVVIALEESEFELIRRRHLNHEASVQSIGSLYYLGGLLTGIVAFSLIAPALLAGELLTPRVYAFGAGFVVLAVASFWLGRGLRTLNPRVKLLAAIFAVAGMVNIPIGTLLGPYILYLLYSGKGQMVFSPEYREIIRQTRHIRYRTPTWLWILLLAIVGLIALAIVAATFAAPN